MKRLVGKLRKIKNNLPELETHVDVLVVAIHCRCHCGLVDPVYVV